MRRKLESLGAVVTLWQVLTAVREHWRSVPRARRERTAELVMRARLRPANLSAAEQAELRKLLGGMGLAQLGRRLAGIAFSKRRTSRRR